MKTLKHLALTATLAATTVCLTSRVMADRVSIGGGIVFGGSSEHSTWQVGIGTGGLGVGVALGGGHGYRSHAAVMVPPPVYCPAPVYYPRPVYYPQPVVVVRQPVYVAPPPVVYAPVVVAAPPPAAPACRALVVEYISPYSRVAQPMIHGYPATTQVRQDANSPWVVVAEHASIW